MIASLPVPVACWTRIAGTPSMSMGTRSVPLGIRLMSARRSVHARCMRGETFGSSTGCSTVRSPTRRPAPISDWRARREAFDAQEAPTIRKSPGSRSRMRRSYCETIPGQLLTTLPDSCHVPVRAAGGPDAVGELLLQLVVELPLHLGAHVEIARAATAQLRDRVEDVADLALVQGEDRADAEVRVRPVEHEEVGEPGDGHPEIGLGAVAPRLVEVAPPSPAISIGARNSVVLKPVARTITSTGARRRRR